MTADRLTPEERAELRRLYDAAAPGSLLVGPHYRSDVLCCANGEEFAHGKPWATPMGDKRAALIAAAINALPALLATADWEAEAARVGGSENLVWAERRARQLAEADRDALRARLAEVELALQRLHAVSAEMFSHNVNHDYYERAYLDGIAAALSDAETALAAGPRRGG